MGTDDEAAAVIVVPLLRAGLERDRRRLVGRRRRRADDPLRRSSGGDGADVLPARRAPPGGPLPGALAAAAPAGTSRSPAARSARPGDAVARRDLLSPGSTCARSTTRPRPRRRPARRRPALPSLLRGPAGRARPRLRAAWTTRPTSIWWRPGSASSRAAGAAEADVLHLHHLTPINEAAERAFPDVPRIGHLHGTELLMLREIDEGPPAGWEHAESWAERMRRWARGCERLLVLSPDAVRRVPALLGVEPERVVWAPNGFDPDGLRPPPARPARRGSRTGAAGWWRSRAAGTSRASRAASPTPRSDLEPFRAGGAGAALRRPLHRGQAHPAADPRPRARAGALRAARAARAARRLPGRVGGRAPARGGARDRRPGRVPGRLARPRGPAAGPQRRRPAGAAVGARAVRRGAGGGDGLRPAGAGRGRPRARPRSSTPARPAGSCRPTTRRRWPTRSWRRSTATPSAAAAASAPTRRRASRYSWPALARGLAQRLRRRSRRGGRRPRAAHTLTDRVRRPAR